MQSLCVNIIHISMNMYVCTTVSTWARSPDTRLSLSVILSLSLLWAFLTRPAWPLLSSPRWDLCLHGILLDKACFHLDLALTAHSSTPLSHTKHTHTHERTSGSLLYSGMAKHPIIIKQTPTRRKGWSISTARWGKEKMEKKGGSRRSGGGRGLRMECLCMCVWSVLPALSVFISRCLLVWTCWWKSNEHEITYLVDQRHKHTWQAGSSSKAPRIKKKTERRVNINTQLVWGLSVSGKQTQCSWTKIKVIINTWL